MLAGLGIARAIIRGNYYVTAYDGTVSIMRGIQGSILGVSMQEPYLMGCLNDRNELSQISYGQSVDGLNCRLMQLEDLRPSGRAQVEAGLPGGSLDQAIDQLRELSHSSLLPLCPAAAQTPTAPTDFGRTASHADAADSGALEPHRHRKPASPAPLAAGTGIARAAVHRCRAAPGPGTPGDRPARAPAETGHRLPGGGMTDQRAATHHDTAAPSPVALTPPLPNRRNAELLLLGFATVITAVALLIVEANQEQGLTWDLATYTLAYLALFVGAHLAIRRFAPYADPLLLPVVALLNGLGLVLIHRLDLAAQRRECQRPQRKPADAVDPGRRGRLPAVVVLLKDHRQLARYGYLCGLAGLVLLAIPALLPRAFSEQNGAKIWIRFPGFSIQPAEFSKILLLIFFAAVLVAKRDLFTSAGKHVLGMDLPRPRDLAPLLAAWIISVGVMVFEKDLGTSLLLYASFLVMVYIATDRVSWVVIGLTLFGRAALWRTHLFGHVRVRVQNWLDPFADPDGTGYQMVQSLFSFATGGMFGTGLGNGQPGTVPAASTDFIIAAVGEELGLVGLAGVLMLYTIVIVRGLRTAIAVRDSFGKLLAAGLAVDPGHPAVHRRRRCHQADSADRADHAVDVLRRFVAAGQLRAAGDPGAHLPCRPAAHRDRTDPAAADRGGDDRGDREGMNTSLRRISMTVMALIVLLLLNATLTQVFTADGLRADPRNQRVLLDEYSRQRGQITAGGQLLAYSVATDGRFRYLRVYPDPLVYAPVTGFYSLRYSSTGLERAEDTVLNGSDERLFGRRLADFFTGRDPRGGNVDTTINPRVQQAAWDAMQSGLQRAVQGRGGGAGTVHRQDPGAGVLPVLRPQPPCLPRHRRTGRGMAAAARRPELAADQPGDLRTLSARFDIQSDHHRGRAAGRRHRERAAHRDAVDPAAGQHRDAGELRRRPVRLRQTTSLREAFARSCNTAFVQLGLRLGSDALRSCRDVVRPGHPHRPDPAAGRRIHRRADLRRRRAGDVEHRAEGRRGDTAAERDGRRDHRQPGRDDAALPGRPACRVRIWRTSAPPPRSSSAVRCPRRSRLSSLI